VKLIVDTAAGLGQGFVVAAHVFQIKWAHTELRNYMDHLLKQQLVTTSQLQKPYFIVIQLTKSLNDVVCYVAAMIFCHEPSRRQNWAATHHK
jgi:hypothetical protein